jgi:hypothetical protein
MSEHLLEDERKLGAEHGIFTLALGWKTRDKKAGTPGDENFEAFVEAVVPGSLNQAEAEVGDSKVRRGRWLGINIPCPQRVGDLYSDLYKQVITALEGRGLST